jgi:hypothetical protein
MNTSLTLSFLQILFFNIFEDKNGTIENEELKGFLKDLLELVKKANNIPLLMQILCC